MSYVEIFSFGENGDANLEAEVHNAHGGAMWIWRCLNAKYKCGCRLFEYENLWKLFNAGQLSEDDNITLGFTFDHVWVKKKNISRLIAALQVFASEFCDKPVVLPSEITGLNSAAIKVVPTIPGIIRALKKALAERNILGVAFNQTSVGEAFWNLYDVPGEDIRPYNILEDDEGHWELFEEIEKAKKTSA